jgi:hypothetical protein
MVVGALVGLFGGIAYGTIFLRPKIAHYCRIASLALCYEPQEADNKLYDDAEP